MKIDVNAPALWSDQQLAHFRLQRLATLGRLVEGAAHDYSNLFTVLQGYSEVVLSHPGLPAELAASVRKLAAAAERVGGMSRQLLAFGRLSFSAPRPVDVNEAIRRWAPLARRLINGGVEVRYQLDPSLPMALVDPAFLDQIIVVGVALLSEATCGSQTIRIATEVGAGQPHPLPVADVLRLTVEGLHSSQKVGLSEVTSEDQDPRMWLLPSDRQLLETACATARIQLEVLHGSEGFGLGWLIPVGASKDESQRSDSPRSACAPECGPTASTLPNFHRESER